MPKFIVNIGTTYEVEASDLNQAIDKAVVELEDEHGVELDSSRWWIDARTLD